MSAAELRLLVEHPQSQALLRFSLNPSRLVHPSRVTSLLPQGLLGCWPDTAQALGDARLHRHWSGVMLAEFGLVPALALDDPGLALGAAPMPLLDDLALYCGVALLAPGIRRVITRTEVALLEAHLGGRGLAFARHGAQRCWGATQSAVPLAAGSIDQQARSLGAAVLDMALDDSCGPVASRARLRLPADASQVRAEVAGAVAGASQAQALALAVLKELDPSWLSSFHVTH